MNGIRLQKISKILLCFLLLSLVLPLYSGCGTQPQEKSFFAMDTLVTLRIYGKDAKEAMDSAVALVLDFEKRYDVRDQDSEVAKINAQAGNWVAVSEDTVAQIQMVKALSSELPQTFSLSLYPVSQLWGFGTDQPTVPTPEALQATLLRVDDANIEVDPQQNRVRIPKGMALDFGGIAKGYLGQKLSEQMQAYQIDAAYLSLGGNVQLCGKKPEDTPWRIGLADPLDSGKTVGVFTVDACAIVTSGNYQRNFTKDGQTYHHILDPKTGMPADTGCASVTVICENGAEADLLSTAFFVAGYENMVKYWRSHAGIEFVWIGTDGEIRVSEGIATAFVPQDAAVQMAVEVRQNA